MFRFEYFKSVVVVVKIGRVVLSSTGVFTNGYFGFKNKDTVKVRIRPFSEY